MINCWHSVQAVLVDHSSGIPVAIGSRAGKQSAADFDESLWQKNYEKREAEIL